MAVVLLTEPRGAAWRQLHIQAEEVGHGHVTYARTRFSMEILYKKRKKVFLLVFKHIPKELTSFESSPEADSEYLANPVQPLGP